MRIAPAVLALAVLGATPAARAQVYLRGQDQPLKGQVAGVSAAGIAIIREGDQGKAVVGWDRVREVRGEHGREAQAFHSLSDQVWRARTRLERGDIGAAEPLLEAVLAEHPDLDGPTGAVVWESLLRCRLRRGAMAGAVQPWLARQRVWMESCGRAAGACVGGRSELGAIVDDRTGLAPMLPPIWLPDAALLPASEGWIAAAGSDAAVKDLAMLYRAAARYELGLNAELSQPLTGGEGVRLVHDVVLARVGDDSERGAAREALVGRLTSKELPAWQEAWCRAAIGRSLLREQDESLRRRGVVQLLHVPARFARATPGLAGVCLAEAAAALKAMNDPGGAAAVKAELVDRMPQHPALGWAPVRDLSAPAEPKDGKARLPGKEGG